MYAQGVAVSLDAGEHWTLSEQRGLTAKPPSFLLFDFYAAPSGRLYHRARQGGDIFRSLDRGRSWSPLTPVPRSLAYALVEEAGSPARLWAVGDGELFRSTDGGASWKPLSPSRFAYHVASPSPGVVLAGTCGVQRSMDGGRTWTQVVPCTVGRPGDPDSTSYQLDRLGVAHGWPGAVWAEVQTSTPGGEFLVLFSQNSGRTWRIVARRIASPPGAHAVAASRGVIYLNRGTALQRSDDGGATWTSHSTGGTILSVAVDAANPDIVYIATRFRGVLRSTDGGQTWNQVNAGLARLGRLWIADVRTDPKVPSVAYAFPVQGGIFQALFTD